MSLVKVIALRDFPHANIDAKQDKAYEIAHGDAIELEKAGFLTIDNESRRKPVDSQIEQVSEVREPANVDVESKPAKKSVKE